MEILITESENPYNLIRNEIQIMEDIYTHLDMEMMQATADDLAVIFKKVDTVAMKDWWEKPRYN